jgi:hypothetical protein
MIKNIASRAANRGNKKAEAEVAAPTLAPEVAVEQPKAEEPKAKRKLSENAKVSRTVNEGKAFPADWVVTKVNPTKYAKGRLDRYMLHAEGQTVGAYLAKAKEKAGWSHASSQADLRWDVAKGHIVIEAPKAS